MTKGRQRFPRIPITVRVTYDYEGSYLFGLAENVSRGGIFIRTDHPLPIGSKISVQFSIPTAPQIIHADGRVIWVTERSTPDIKDQMGGMGIEFLKLGSPEQEELLKAHIEKEQARRPS
jgi:type IV pilus assembly protein PilZ